MNRTSSNNFPVITDIRVRGQYRPKILTSAKNSFDVIAMHNAFPRNWAPTPIWEYSRTPTKDLQFSRKGSFYHRYKSRCLDIKNNNRLQCGQNKPDPFSTSKDFYSRMGYSSNRMHPPFLSVLFAAGAIAQRFVKARPKPLKRLKTKPFLLIFTNYVDLNVVVC